MKCKVLHVYPDGSYSSEEAGSSRASINLEVCINDNRILVKLPGNGAEVKASIGDKCFIDKGTFIQLLEKAVGNVDVDSIVLKLTLSYACSYDGRLPLAKLLARILGFEGG